MNQTGEIKYNIHYTKTDLDGNVLEEGILDLPYQGAVTFPATFKEIKEKVDIRATPTGTWVLNTADGVVTYRLLPVEFPPTPEHEMKYYILFRYNYLNSDGKIDAGFITHETYTLEHIRKTYPKATTTGTWHHAKDTGKILWLLSAESLHTPPSESTHEIKKNSSVDEIRIYWTSLLSNLYERLNNTGKTIANQYLKQKPWNNRADHISKPRSDQDFTDLVMRIAFENDSDIIHLEKLGEHIKTIYALDMNRGDKGSYFSIPEPPKRAEPPVERMKLTLVTKTKAGSESCKRAMEIYERLGQKGYHAIRSFMTTPPMPGKTNGRENPYAYSPQWFKNLLSYLTPDELKNTVDKLEELIRDNNNVDRVELSRRENTKIHDRKVLILRLHKIFCGLNQYGIDILKAHFASIGQKDFGWHLFEAMTFEEMTAQAIVVDNIAADPRNMERWAFTPTPKSIEKMFMTDRARKIYSSLNIEGYRLVHKFLSSPTMPVNKGFFGDIIYNIKAFNGVLEIITEEQLVSLLAKMEEIFLDDKNVDINESKRRAAKPPTSDFLARANKIYKGLDDDCKRKVYASVCDIFWGGTKEKDAYFDDNAFWAATNEFDEAKAAVLLSILEQISADEIEENRAKVTNKATALFRKLNKEGRDHVQHLMTQLPWLIIDNTKDFTLEYLEALMLNRGHHGNGELLQIVEGVFAEPKYRTDKKVDASAIISDVNATITLFYCVNVRGREQIAKQLSLFQWVHPNLKNGSLAKKIHFNKFMKSISMGHAKEVRAIVIKVHEDPANRCQ